MKKVISNTQQILKPGERKTFAGLILLNAIVTTTEICSLALLTLFISIYTGNWNGELHPLLQWIHADEPLKPIAVILGIFVIRNVTGQWLLVRQNKYVYSVASRLSEQNLVRFFEGSYADYVNTDSSVQVKKILHQPIEFCHYVLSGLLRIGIEMIMSIAILGILLWFNASLVLLLACVLAPPVLIVMFFAKKKLKRAREEAKTSSERTIQYLQESLAGYVESNIYDKKDFFAGRFAKYQQDMMRHLADVETALGLPSRIIEVFAVAGVFMIILSNKLLGSGAVQLINIGTFIAAAYKIIPGIVKMMNAAAQIRLYEYTVNDLMAADKPTATTTQPTDTLSSVHLNDISFAHQRTVLNGFNFNIEKGELIGITGPSGAGKTTFVNLLLGFHTQQKGEILFNGTATDNTHRQRYWKKIAFVQQRPFLIHDSMHANITLSDEGDVNRLKEVINVVDLGELSELASGGKLIKENGKNISGGQRQRLAIARALYKQADLIILDEPFSELDGVTEQRILLHLKEQAASGAMVILITHKKENLAYCHRTYDIG